jgi:Zn-dependent M28 family amino/carboxypeptidase
LVYIKAGENAGQGIFSQIQSGKNVLIVADTSHQKALARFRNFRMQRMAGSGSVVVVLYPGMVDQYKVQVSAKLTGAEFANVVGIIRGKSKQEERVVFSAHYDHLGIGKPKDQDSIYNGANDDASGTTAVIALAKYFKKMKQPERTLVFATFTAEESGGYGAQYFSRQMDPATVMAMFNIEMIGTDSKWGKNSAYITGYEKSDFGKILQDNLKGSAFEFHPDPYPSENLFYRSDNATLARLGVPAHTISTSKMDSEKFYHTVDDEIETLDTKNMTEIIKAIALSSKGIVSGTQTPGRVKE